MRPGSLSKHSEPTGTGADDDVIDANLQSLLRQRQQLMGRRGLQSDRCSDGQHMSPRLSDMCRSAGERPSLFAIPQPAVGPFTPDRPTHPRDRADTHHTFSRYGPPDPEPSFAYSLPGTCGSAVPTGSASYHDPTSFTTYPSVNHSRTSDTSQMQQQQRWERERQEANRRTEDLIAALDAARQTALLRDREAQVLRASLLDCEDRLERLHCEDDLVRSCYQRDRRYFVAFAHSALLSSEESERREITSKESEWRTLIALTAVRAAASPQPHRAWHEPTCVASASSPPSCPAGPAAGTHNQRELNEGEVTGGKRSACAGWSSSESVGISPRSHRLSSATQQRPPLSPVPDERGGQAGSAAVGRSGSAPSARVMKCKANLLAEVSSAKRRVEEELAQLKTEFSEQKEATAERERTLLATIAVLERELSEERQLTADMQSEIDDMIVSELRSCEAESRLTIAVEASTAHVALFSELASHAVKLCLGLGHRKQATEKKTAFNGGPNEQRCVEEEGDHADEVPEGEHSTSTMSFVTLPGGGDPSRSHPLTSKELDGAHDGYESTGEVESPLSNAGTREAKRATAASALGKSVLKHLLSGNTSSTLASPSPEQNALTSDANSTGSQHQLVSPHAVQPQQQRLKVRHQREHLLPPLSPMRSSAHLTASAPNSTKSDALEVLTPVTASFDASTTPLPRFADDGEAVKRRRGGGFSCESSSPQPAPSSQGVSPDQQTNDKAEALTPTAEEPDAPIGSSLHVHAQIRVDERPRPEEPHSPLCSPSASKQVHFQMPHFPRPTGGSHEDAGRFVAQSSPTPGGATSAMDSSNRPDITACAEVPDEELFQPQGLSFPSLSSHLWDLIDSDDGSIPTPPTAGSFSRLLGNPRSSVSSKQQCGKAARHRPLRNPYDDDDDN